MISLLTSQNHHMLVHDQGLQALQEIGHLSNHIGYLDPSLFCNLQFSQHYVKHLIVAGLVGHGEDKDRKVSPMSAEEYKLSSTVHSNSEDK